MSNKIVETKTNQELTPAQKAEKLLELQKIYKEIKPQIDALKEELLQTMQEQDVLTLRTGTYTLYRAKRVTPQVVNFEKLKASLEEKGIPYSTKEVFADFMKETFKQAIDEGQELEGLEGLVTEYVGVRVADKGK